MNLELARELWIDCVQAVQHVQQGPHMKARPAQLLKTDGVQLVRHVSLENFK